ncbi:hypothetical protein B0H19DRAFT_233243 [Mycena capillaripes]|nr:hypothetical protein B0H19DRAFT_233243 [Mycena capillaripes]
MALVYDDDVEMVPPLSPVPDDDDESVLGPGLRGFGDETDNWEEGRPDEDEREESDEEDDPEDNNFAAAPWLRGLNALDVLSEEFEKYIAHIDPKSRLSDDDLRDIRAFNLKVETSLGNRDFEKLRRSKLVRNIETLHRIQTRVAFLSGIKPVPYHCCVKSCVCFVWKYENHTRCPHCHEEHYNHNDKPRHIFWYLPLIPRLVNSFLDPAEIKKMRYRADYDTAPTGVADAFDGTHYQRLRTEFVRVGVEKLGHRFFELLTDIALALSTDGVGPFKRGQEKMTRHCRALTRRGCAIDVAPHSLTKNDGSLSEHTK